MHSIKAIRHDPAAFDRAMQRRGLESQAESLLAQDAAYRDGVTKLQTMQQERNAASKAVGAAMKAGDTAQAETLKTQVSNLKDEMTTLESETKALKEKLDFKLAALPNIPDTDVPEGNSDEDNVTLSRWGEPKDFNFTPKDHIDLGEALGMMDFERAAQLSGSRFVVLSDKLAKLERALAQFFLQTLTEEFGYKEMSVPLLVKDSALFGTGQLPKFAEDLYQTTDGRWLIPTSEVSLTNLVAEQIQETSTLPLRFTAFTPCFRSEAGAAGKDTRGMIRQHQFYKVEMVSITTPEGSTAEHERMTNAAEHILQALKLPYEKMLLCLGDLGFGAQKTYDFNVWLPGQGKYREISSISNCGAFQARRMNARYRPEGEKSTAFVHTLNGSGLAVGRCLVAVLENYQNADGSITVPEILKPWMGCDVITSS